MAINSSSISFIENFRILVTNGSTAQSGITGTVIIQSVSYNFTTDANGFTDWYYVAENGDLNITGNIPSQGSFNETPISHTFVGPNQQIEVILLDAASVVNFESPVIFANLPGGTTQESLEDSGVLISDNRIKNRYNIYNQNEFSTFLLTGGDEFKLLLNFDPGIDIEGYQVNLLNCDFSINTSGVTTVGKISSGGEDRFTIEFTAPSIIDDFIRIGIYNGVTPVWVALTAISFVSQSDSCDYPFVKWRNYCNEFGFKYEFDTSFYNQLRMELIKLGPLHEYDTEKEEVLTTGELINESFEHDKSNVFEAYYQDSCSHDAISVVIASDELFINDRQWRIKNGYDVEFNPDHEVQKATFELYDVDWSKRSNE